MNFIAAYKEGWRQTIRRKKMWLMIYLMVMGTAFLFSIPFFQIMNDAIGSSLELQRLLPEYDNTVYRDFMNVHGDKFTGIRAQIIVLVPFFLLFFVLLTGGMLDSFKRVGEPFRFGAFWSACTRYFWSILGVFAFFTLLQFILAALFYAPFFKWMGESIYNVSSELVIFRTGIILVIVHLVLAAFLATVSDIAKVKMVQDNRASFFKEIRHAFGFVRKNFFRVYPFYLLVVLTGLLFFGAYWLIETGMGMVSVATILLMFVIQQIYVFLRLGTKILSLAGATALHQNHQPEEFPENDFGPEDLSEEAIA